MYYNGFVYEWFWRSGTAYLFIAHVQLIACPYIHR